MPVTIVRRNPETKREVRVKAELGDCPLLIPTSTVRSFIAAENPPPKENLHKVLKRMGLSHIEIEVTS